MKLIKEQKNSEICSTHGRELDTGFWQENFKKTEWSSRSRQLELAWIYLAQKM
jgi:hypothetical protein